MGRGGPPGFAAMKGVKAFVGPRSQSVSDQLEGRTSVAAEARPDFRGPGGFDPAALISEWFLKAMDSNRDRALSSAEFDTGLDNLFRSWNSDQSGKLTESQLRTGIEKDLLPRPPMGPGGPGRPL